VCVCASLSLFLSLCVHLIGGEVCGCVFKHSGGQWTVASSLACHMWRDSLLPHVAYKGEAYIGASTHALTPHVAGGCHAATSACISISLS
jgi:hypothetical protein